jgi:hypothetical protein
MNTPFAILADRSFVAENNFGDTIPNGVAGPTGLFITALLFGALYLLMRSMNKRLRRLPESFPTRRPGRVPVGEQAPPAQVPPAAAQSLTAAQSPDAVASPAATQPPAEAEASPAGAQPAPPDASA